MALVLQQQKKGMKRQRTPTCLSPVGAMTTPKVHPFKVAWSGQPAVRGAPRRGQEGCLRRQRPTGGDTKPGASGGLARRRGRLAALVLGLAGIAALLVVLHSRRPTDPCSSPEVRELIRVQSGQRPEETVDVPLPEFHYHAFRELVGDEFEVRQGAGAADVQFRRRSTGGDVAQPRGSWTRGHLVGSISKPRLGKQRFTLWDRPLECFRADGAPFAGQLLIFTAFRQQYEGEPLTGVGSWWVRDGGAFSNRTTALGLAMNEAARADLPGRDAGRHIKRRLEEACGNTGRFPQVP